MFTSLKNNKRAIYLAVGFFVAFVWVMLYAGTGAYFFGQLVYSESTLLLVLSPVLFFVWCAGTFVWTWLGKHTLGRLVVWLSGGAVRLN